MKDILRELFDYQRFENNSELAALIDQTSKKYMSNSYILSDDDLALVAGGVVIDANQVEVKDSEDSQS